MTVTRPTPHLDKLRAALTNPKCKADVPLLKKALTLYEDWVSQVKALSSTGQTRVVGLVQMLNQYKDTLEVELILKRGSDFLRRQKGQLKLDNSIIEEFLVQLIHPSVFGTKDVDKLTVGPQNAFMSLSFRPAKLATLNGRPDVVLKTKDQDFVLGAPIHYQVSSAPAFDANLTTSGSLVLAVVAVECKINLDKTMFQEAAGTATRLKLGCPVAKYFVLVEYLDMQPEDCRLTDIDNVYLLRKTKRLPFEKRSDIVAVTAQRRNHPVDPGVVWHFTQELGAFISATWYDPADALRKGRFV